MAEKDIPSGHHDDMANLMRSNTADSIMIPRDLLEKMYLNPPTTPKGSLRSIFANPTPLGVAGLAVCALPLACDLLGWRGAGGMGAASIGTFLFFGGTALLVTAILEWVLGNSFAFAVFAVYGCFWFSFATSLIPDVGAVTAYGNGTASSFAEGLMSPEFAASYGFWTATMTLISTIFTVAALRTNIMFVLALFSITLAFGFITGAEWNLANGNMSRAVVAQKGAGGCVLAVAIETFYLFTALIMQTVDFPLPLPVGDLSWMPSMTSIKESRAEKGHQA